MEPVFLERLKWGIILVEAVLIGFLFFGQRSTDIGRLIFGGVAALAVYYVYKFVLSVRMMADVYKVAKDVIPDLLFDAMGVSEINTSKINVEPFEDVYLVEYQLNTLTVIWDAVKGVEGHRYLRLEDLKKTLKLKRVEQVRMPLEKERGAEQPRTAVREGGGYDEE